jgi:hypothetical protein
LCWDLDQLPFRHTGHECPFETELPYGLGPTDPRPTAVRVEPFSTLVLQVPIEVFATTTKIRTGGRSTRAHAQGFVTDPRACLLLGASILPRGGAIGGTLSAIHFQGWHIRQVSCYTVLSGFRLPWPPSCCQDVPTPFVVSHERPLRHLKPPYGSSHIASSAYQKWPTRVDSFKGLRSPK